LKGFEYVFGSSKVTSSIERSVARHRTSPALDADHLEYEVTFDDPKTYSKPFKNTRVWSRMKVAKS